jgi:putative glutamine amidotransferase
MRSAGEDVTKAPRIAVAWAKPDYLASLREAGAEPVDLDPARDAVSQVLAACDGLLLTGGLDVDPAVYGEADRHPTVELAPERDDYELALARTALARGLPILAICRGAQVLNVAAGGTLVQDLPSQQPSTLGHSVVEPRTAIAHAVTVLAGTRLADALGDRLGPDQRVAVNSRHHQAVRTVAPGFVQSAIAPDGVIEAIERPSGPFCVGVQWHPENFWRTGEFAPLFRSFVDSARRS